MKYLLLSAVSLLGLPLGAIALEVPGDGTPVELSLDGASGGNATFFGSGVYTEPGLFVEVPEGVQQLRLVLEGQDGGDVDLVVRYGREFELSRDLFDQTEFLSAGPDHLEHVTVTRASNPPLVPGRWYIAPINFDAAATQANLRVIASSDPQLDEPELVPLYDSQEEVDETGFFDPAPFTSPHNPANSLGAARRMAFERALEIASEELKNAGVTSPVPVLVAATFEDLGGFDDDENQGVTLAQAGPAQGFFSTFPGALRADTFYAAPLAAKQAGTDACRFGGGACGDPDVVAVFNSHEDVDWSYALESVSSPADFISVTMHEVTHGLGFVSLFPLEDDDGGAFNAGELPQGIPDIYTRNLVHVAGGNATPLPQLDDAGRVEAATSVNGLRWAGANVAASPGNPFTGLDQLYAMYAPAAVEPGSSVSHVNDRAPVAASELMRHRSSIFSPRNIGHTGAFMLDLGWGGEALGSAGHPIHFGMTGLWFNPETSGQGFLFDIAATQDPPQAAVFWFTFADEAGGPAGQRWYTAQGDYSEGDTSVELTVYMTTGGAFDRRPPVPETTPVGEMTLAFQSCTEATLSYNFDLDNDPAKRVQGTMPVSRISPDVYCEAGMHPDEFPIASPPAPVVLDPVLNGSWFEPTTSGQGLLFEVVDEQDPPQLVALWFTYAETAGGPQGQRWFIAQGDYTPGAREVTLDVRMSLGGEFDRRPPEPELVTVGTVEVEFESCTEAEFEYDINLDNVPGEGTEGRIALQRLTPDILCHKSFR